MLNKAVVAAVVQVAAVADTVVATMVHHPMAVAAAVDVAVAAAKAVALAVADAAIATVSKVVVVSAKSRTSNAKAMVVDHLKEVVTSNQKDKQLYLPDF